MFARLLNIASPAENDVQKQKTEQAPDSNTTRPPSPSEPRGKLYMKCIVLVSSLQSSVGQEADQRRMRDVLNAKGLLFVEVDGAQEENRATRTALFAISGLRGKYPQVFLQPPGDAAPTFVGTWEKLEVGHGCLFGHLHSFCHFRIGENGGQMHPGGPTPQVLKRIRESSIVRLVGAKPPPV
ncbi:unnamed protein product [Phaeothamnion confervicola]